MFKLISARSISAAVAAALVGSFAAFLTPVAPQARAETQVRGNPPRAFHVKGRPSPPARNGTRMLLDVLAEL